MNYYLSIDIGTTSVKTSIYNSDFKKVIELNEEYTTVYLSSVKVEQNPMEWWQATVITIKKILIEKPSLRNKICSICVSSHAPTLLPLDESGNPLRNALIWADRRSTTQCQEFNNILSNERIISITGNRLDPYYLIGKLLWFRENEKCLFDKTAFLLQANGFINYKLTDVVSCDSAHASLTGLYDITSNKWSNEICNKANIDLSILPPIFKCTDIIGKVSQSAAAETGLPEFIPVTAGNVDASSAALEAGVTGHGEAVEMTGTTTVLMAGGNFSSSHGTLVNMNHVFTNTNLLIGPISSTGSVLKWYRNNIGCTKYDDNAKYEENPYQYMDELAAKAKPGSGGLIFLPYLSGERSPIWDPHARGVIFGLTHNTSRHDIVRSILEGTSYALYYNVMEAEKSGALIDTLYSVGGGSNSDLWLQIKANVLNKKIVTIDSSSGGGMGNSLIAAMSVNHLECSADTIKKFIKEKKTYQPDQKLHEYYKLLFEVYKSIYHHTKPDFEILSSITGLV